jgi:beta-barrel assembly-enhancing protease
MFRTDLRKKQILMTWLTALALLAAPFSLLGQTRITLHTNKYSPQDDVKLGRQAAAEAERQFPLLRDPQVGDYIERIGRRLAAAIPPEFQHPEFQYYFKVVNASDINAFALPGGPMYVNRGMIEAAKNEGEVAGVMAHELSHVALRHGTAQATKAQKYSLLSGIAGIAGSIVGGPALGQLAQTPFGVYFLKYSREYETEADVLGSQIMANAGYNPLDLANMFRTIEQTGSGGGGWFSDHPSPSNRYARIQQEAQMLRVRNNVYRDTGDFQRIQARLRGYSPAPSTAQIQRSGQRYPSDGGNYPDNNNYPESPSGRVEYPSSRYRNYNALGGLIRVSVPDNWVELPQNNSVWYAPQGGYGQSGFTHGVNIGVAQTRYNNLSTATDDLLNNLAQGNRSLRRSGGNQRITVDGRQGLLTSLTNVNDATGRSENIRVITTQSRNADLIYMVFVQPNGEGAFDSAFNNVVRSVRIND